MKSRSNLFAMLLLVGSLALSVALDARFADAQRQASETFQMVPRVLWSMGINFIFVLLEIFLLWILLIRNVPDRLVYIVYLFCGLLLVAYLPANLLGLDYQLGLVPNTVRFFLKNFGLHSFLILNSIMLAAIGGIGLVPQVWRR